MGYVSEYIALRISRLLKPVPCMRSKLDANLRRPIRSVPVRFARKKHNAVRGSGGLLYPSLVND